jgi:hypothetical protein
MRRLAMLFLFAITLAVGSAAVGPGGMSAAYADPPDPCEW